MEAPIIKLNGIVLWNAINIGVYRQLDNLMKGRKDKYGAEKMDGWGIHIEGACGEAVVAKFFNVYYDGNIGDLKAHDVNHPKIKIEVRTRKKDWHDLIVHPDDKDDAFFILVTGKVPVFTLRGYIKGIDAKKYEFWKDPAGGRPAYFVPQDALNPIQELQNKYIVCPSLQWPSTTPTTTTAL